MRAGDIAYARELHQEALEINPESPRVQAALANFLESQREFERALEHYDLATSLSEDYWVVQRRGALLLAMGDLDGALVDFERAIDLNPEYSAAYRGRGRAFFREGNYGLALADVERALALARTQQERAVARFTLRSMLSQHPN
jgi:tetratricopeptide (TPR) repeat protein